MFRFCSIVVVGWTLACATGPGPVTEGVDASDEGIIEHSVGPVTQAPTPRRARVRGGFREGASEPVPAPVALEVPPGGVDAAPAVKTDVVLSRAGLEADLAEVDSIGEVIGLLPHITLRGIDGFTVTKLPAGSPLGGIGLVEGDVIHSVNGRKLNSIKAAFAAGEALQTAEVLEGEITRDGVRQRIRVRLE